MTDEHVHDDAADGAVPPATPAQPGPVEQPTTPPPPPPPAPEPVKKGGKKRVVLGVLGLLLLLAVAAVFTLDVEIGSPTPGTIYPYMTTYNAWFPDGEPVTVGNARMMVLSYDNELILDVNGNREKLVVGDEKEVAEHHASMKVFGVTLLSTDFKMLMKYRGLVEGKENFFLSVKTSRQVPEFVVGLLLPKEIQAQPA
ncbi:MAG: hypothetical protein PHP59_03590 [Methanofollis sp.]|uniref:hypothetical protein n=1 Tax=Methanofollis sp. TaxID=2052835 RepID=UPI0026165B6D|nr:hypothetical protein [Methanofollis sp.]MDD4254438.1 hypothetical protein [Methanofollis sp.]